MIMATEKMMIAVVEMGTAAGIPRLTQHGCLQHDLQVMLGASSATKIGEMNAHQSCGASTDSDSLMTTLRSTGTVV